VKVDSEPAETALLSARRSGGGWWRAACPYCLDETGKPDKRQSLGLKPSIAFFQCFKCGARGRLRAISDAVLALEAKAVDRAPVPIKAPPDEYESITDGSNWDSIFFRIPRSYLERRGVTRDIAASARIGVALDGRLAGRIIVPVLDVDECTWLGYSARDYTDKLDPRYRYPRGMARGVLLYNWAALYARTDAPLILVEGVFDALPYWPDCVASLGKPGDYHRRLLIESTRPVAVCLDGDAHEEGWALSEYLRLHGSRSGSVQLPPGADPNTVEPSWLIEEARRCIR
jgi:DNA primase